MADSPSYFQTEEFQNRSRKLAEIRTLGVEPYPHSCVTAKKIGPLLTAMEGKEVGHYDDAAAGGSEAFAIRGRLVLFRSMGKNIFAHLQDETGRLQILCNRDLTEVTGLTPTEEVSHHKFIEKKLDLGDWIGVEGHLFRTQKGELTLFAKRLTLLSKSLLPLPDKHSGLVDKGVRYRKRWLDLISHSDSLKVFQTRSRILTTIRRYFAEADFLEVETPVLQNLYGGAEARPFTTHLHALHQEMYLRIALEISLKKLIVGGMERVYEIGKIFRNEGIDRTHNPEFTMLEAYAAGWDYWEMMTFTEHLFARVALELFGDTKIRIATEGEHVVIDLTPPWKRLSMKEALITYASLDPDRLSDEEMRTLLLQKSSADPKRVNGAPRGTLIALCFEEFAEEFLVQPHHIIDHPIETTPLCKPHRNPELRKAGLVERFESFILGREICNAYSELNDPELQRTLLVQQAEKREKGDLEASPLDEEFLEAICQGMPPTAGVGIGIDRLVMLFTSAESIRDILFFPITKPEE
ncbi:MAG: lysine--tRNA ligase [Verrucomicrobiota bacterium]|nr:lysine--tRNA ligase [Verrucomicrobiota bacterium]